MFEWESDVDIGELIEAQRLRIEREKERQRLESEANRLIDDRISKYNTELEIQRLLMDKATRGIEEQISLQLALEKAVKSTDAKERAKIGSLLEAIKTQRTLNAEQLNGLMQNTVMTTKLKNKLVDVATEMKSSTDPKRLMALAVEFEKLQAQIKDTKSFNDSFGSSLQSVASKFGLVAHAGNNKTLGPMIRMFADLTKEADTLPAKLAGIGQAFAGMFGPLNLAVMFVGKLIDLMMGLDKAQANIAKSTGLMRQQYEGLISANITPELTGIGIKLPEIEKATNELLKTNGVLAMSNKQAAESLVNLGAKMTALGGTTSGTVKNVQKLSNLMGGKLLNNFKDAEKQYNSVIARGRELGLTTAEMEQGLGQFAGQLSGMGGDVGDEFLKMATMAKNAGVEINKLAGIAKSFQTFKNGADKAAELNSVLGTSISSIEMMGKTGAERLDIIRQQLNATSGGFQGMDRYTQLAAAEILGFGDDLGALAGFMNNEMSPAQKKAEQDKKTAAENEKKQREAIIGTRDAMSKMVDAIDKIVIALTPLTATMEIFLSIVDGVVGVMDFFSTAIDTVINGTGFMVNVIRLAMIAIGALTMLNYAAATAYGVSAMAATELGFVEKVKAVWEMLSAKATSFKTMATLSSIGPTIAAAAANFTLGGAIKFMLGPIGLLIMALVALAAAYAISNSPPLWQIAAVMAIGVIALGIAFHLMGIQGQLAAFALALLAGAIALVFYGIGYVIEQFKELLLAVPALIGMLPQLVGMFVDMVVAVGALGVAMGVSALLVAGALYIFALGFIAVGQAGMFASFGIMMGFLAVLALVAILALAGSSISDLAALGESVLSIGEGIKAFGEGLSSMASGAAALIGSLGGNKTLFVRKSAESTTMIAGKAGGFFMIPPTIKVDVKVPDVDMSPNVTVNVYIDGEEFRGMIHEEVNSTK